MTGRFTDWLNRTVAHAAEAKKVSLNPSKKDYPLCRSTLEILCLVVKLFVNKWRLLFVDFPCDSEQFSG